MHTPGVLCKIVSSTHWKMDGADTTPNDNLYTWRDPCRCWWWHHTGRTCWWACERLSLETFQQQEIKIKPVQFSDWAASIVPVVKSDGSACICGDHKVTINPVDKYPIPCIKDLFSSLSGGAVVLFYLSPLSKWNRSCSAKLGYGCGLNMDLSFDSSKVVLEDFIKCVEYILEKTRGIDMENILQSSQRVDSQSWSNNCGQSPWTAISGSSTVCPLCSTFTPVTPRTSIGSHVYLCKLHSCQVWESENRDMFGACAEFFMTPLFATTTINFC